MKHIWKLSGALGVVAIGLAGCGGSSGGGPAKTNGVVTYTQQERLARPVVNEVLATVAQRRHRVNNIDNPTDDSGQLQTDIKGFMKFPAGRSDAIANVVASVLVPDVMKADLSQSGPQLTWALKLAVRPVVSSAGANCRTMWWTPRWASFSVTPFPR